MEPRPLELENLTTHSFILQANVEGFLSYDLHPQSEQNHYPMKLLVFTAICKEMFYWLPNPYINVLLLSNLGLVYSMFWKESALWKSCCLPWGNDCVAAFILEPGHGCVYHTKRHQMGYFITYSSIYCGEMSLLLSVFQRNKVLSVICHLHIQAPCNTSSLKLHANARSICLYRNYLRIAFRFWILDCPNIPSSEPVICGYTVWLLVAWLSRILYLSVRQEWMQLSTNNVVVKFW